MKEIHKSVNFCSKLS